MRTYYSEDVIVGEKGNEGVIFPPGFIFPQRTERSHKEAMKGFFSPRVSFPFFSGSLFSGLRL